MLSKAHREAGNLLALEHRTAGGGASRVAEGWSRIRAEADTICRFRRRLVAGRRGLDLGSHQLRRAGGAGRAGGLAPELPGSVPGGDGRTCRQAPGLRTERSEELGPAVRERADPHRGQRLQRLRGDVAPHHGDGAAAVSGVLGHHRADDAGLRRPAGRPKPAGLQRFNWSAGHRGQWRRLLARSGTTDQSRRIHPCLSRGGRRAAADATAGRAGTK